MMKEALHPAVKQTQSNIEHPDYVREWPYPIESKTLWFVSRNYNDVWFIRLPPFFHLQLSNLTLPSKGQENNIYQNKKYHISQSWSKRNRHKLAAPPEHACTYRGTHVHTHMNIYIYIKILALLLMYIYIYHWYGMYHDVQLLDEV